MKDRATCAYCQRNIYLSAATGRWLHGNLDPQCSTDSGGTRRAVPASEDHNVE